MYQQVPCILPAFLLPFQFFSLRPSLPLPPLPSLSYSFGPSPFTVPSGFPSLIPFHNNPSRLSFPITILAQLPLPSVFPLSLSHHLHSSSIYSFCAAFPSLLPLPISTPYYLLPFPLFSLTQPFPASFPLPYQPFSLSSPLSFSLVY